MPCFRFNSSNVIDRLSSYDSGRIVRHPATPRQLLAVPDSREARHPTARELWHSACKRTSQWWLVNSYVLVETLVLIQNRLGLSPVNVSQRAAAPVLHIDWIDTVGHSASVTARRGANQRWLAR